MHVKLYMHERLTAGWNLYKFFLRKIQNLNAADFLQFQQNFHAVFKNIHAQLQILHAFLVIKII